MDQPFAVDVVVNNHDYGRFVGDAIESALAQTHPDVHVIVVDDGSTDGSREVIEQFDHRATVVLKENGGQASAFNAGFAHLRGDAAVFLDADDVLAPEAAALVAAAFAREPSAAKVQYRMEVIDASARRTGVLKPPSHRSLPAGDLRRQELTFPFDLVWPPTSANAFATSVLRSLLPMPEEEFPLGADWYVGHLAPLYGPVVSLDEVGAYYRVHGGNRYEQASPALDLRHVRQSVVYGARTREHLQAHARELGLPWGREAILSVSDLANRLVSLKLDPDRHPLREDTVGRLALDGARAAARRFDVSPALRVLFAGWFAAQALAPRLAARPLAELFLFPERRTRANAILGALHRREAAAERGAVA